MEIRKTKKIVFLVICSLSMIYISGCASTVPTANFSRQIAPDSLIASTDDAKVKIKVGFDVEIMDGEKTRLAEAIEQRITALKVKNSRNGEKRLYEVELLLTRYDAGNAFARLMLAGLGQIHIDGEVKLIELPERKIAGEFSIKKTFAWGGLYGGSVNIEDIENTFADGVAQSITNAQ